MSSTVFLPNYTAGTDAYEKIPEICGGTGKTAVVIGGKTAMSKAKAKLIAAVKDSSIEITDFLWYGGDATHKNVDALINNKIVRNADMIFAVGGGRAVDTAKTTADKLNKPLFTFPTIASNCAAVTSLCILYKGDGSFGEFYFGKKPALHTFIDTQIIAEAPTEYFMAGIGDALSKQYEADFNSRKDKNKIDHENTLGLQISRNISAELLKYGLQALKDARQGEESDAFVQTILDIIVNTGLVSVLVDNYYNSSMAHALYISRTQLPGCEAHMHGEIVAYGVLFLLTLDQQFDERNKVYNFNKAAGLPVCLADITVAINMFDKFVAGIAADKYIPHAPFAINEENIAEALRKLEAYHKENA